MQLFSSLIDLVGPHYFPHIFCIVNQFYIYIAKVKSTITNCKFFSNVPQIESNSANLSSNLIFIIQYIIIWVAKALINNYWLRCDDYLNCFCFWKKIDIFTVAFLLYKIFSKFHSLTSKTYLLSFFPYFHVERVFKMLTNWQRDVQNVNKP